MKAIVTGGAGFVGSHLVRHLLTETDWHLYLPVTFTHRGNADRLDGAIADNPGWLGRITVLHHDLRAAFSTTQLHRMGDAEIIFNVAAESHVDRSITEPVPFIHSNVAVATSMLECARALQPRVFIQVSTDEVYGPAPHGHEHPEWSPIIPSNPYSASKAAQEAIAVSYWRTYNVPLILTNTMNIFGEMQDREKFIPKSLRALLLGEQPVVHVSPTGEAGSRFYLHARNQADALLFLARNVTPAMYPDADRPDRFNVVGEREVNNVEMLHLIAAAADVEPVYTTEDFHSSRPGHDLRYALDGGKLAKLGWTAPVSFEDSLAATVGWTLQHREWLL